MRAGFPYGGGDSFRGEYNLLWSWHRKKKITHRNLVLGKISTTNCWSPVTYSEILTSFWVGYLKNSARDAGVGWTAFTTMAPHESLLLLFHPNFNKLARRREVDATMSLRGTESWDVKQVNACFGLFSIFIYLKHVPHVQCFPGLPTHTCVQNFK